MSLTDDLSMTEWQRRRNAQLLAGGVEGAVSAPSDDMPMDDWQRARTQQAAVGPLSGGAGDDVLAGGAGTDPLGAPLSGAGFNLNREFLAEREGAHPDMRVPINKKTGQVFGHSGPTIGVGVDLGQKDAAYLKSARVAPQLAARLAPYLGRRGAPALDFVKANPLVLANHDLDALNTAVQDFEFGKLASKFDAASQVGPFRQLPRDTQTAIASLFYQYGTDVPDKKAPNYWRQITSGDWNGAYGNLRKFGDAYQPRRDLEAALLQNDIRSGRLPGARQYPAGK